MVDYATALVIYKTCAHVHVTLYSAFVQCCVKFNLNVVLPDPHIDSRSRAVEAVRVIADTIEGHIKPTMALAKPPIIPLVNMQFTARGLARELMEELSVLESAAERTEPGTAPVPVESWSGGRSSHTEVISSSLAFGFPWADISHVGMAFVVCTNDDHATAKRIADQLAAKAWERREEFVCPLATPSEAVDEAIALHAADGGCITSAFFSVCTSRDLLPSFVSWQVVQSCYPICQTILAVVEPQMESLYCKR